MYQYVPYGRDGVFNMSPESRAPGNLLNDISAFQDTTNYNITQWMWGKSPDAGFNVQDLYLNNYSYTFGCPDADYSEDSNGMHCNNTYVMNSQMNSMNCMKGNGANCGGFPGTGADISPADIQANFP